MTSSQSVSRKLTIAAALLGLSTLLSSLLGFVRDAVIAGMLGAGRETDTYLASFTVPDLMSYFLAGGALSISFIPLYSRVRRDEGDEEASRLASTLLTTVGGLLCVAVVVGMLFARPLVGLLVPDFPDDQLDATTTLTRIVFPAQLFFFVGGILNGVLMANERFLTVALVPLIYNLGIIGFGVALAPSMGVAGFSVGVLVGAFVGALLVPAWACRRSFRFRPRFAPRDRHFRRYLRLSLPLMLGVTLLTTDEIIGRYFASGMTPGTITWLGYARRLMVLPMTLIGKAAGQAALPFLARLAAEGREDEFSRTLEGTLRGTLFLAVLATVFLMIAAEPTVAAVYQRGAFDAADSLATAGILVVLAPSIVALAGQAVAARGFYAREDTVRPMVVGTVVTALSLPVYAALGESFGARGLALATSSGLAVTLVGTIAWYQVRYGGLRVGRLGASAAKGLAVATAAGVPSYLLVGRGPDLAAALPAPLVPWVLVAGSGALFALALLVATPLLGGVEGQAVRKLTARFTGLARRLRR